MPEETVTRGAKVWAQHLARQAVRKGEIEKAEACERCSETGDLHGHHADYSRPLDVEWLCRSCHGAEHRSEPLWLEKARELRAQGLSYVKIGEALGVSQSTVHKRLHPEKAREYDRRQNAKRPRAEKRRRQAVDRRRRDHRGTCEGCGGPMGAAWDGLCRVCRKRRSHKRAMEVARRWNAGESMAEIAAALGWTEETLGSMMVFYRRKGYDLPLRAKRLPGNSIRQGA